MADSEGNRQLSMPREDRVKVCQHIMGKLGSYYRSVPEAALKEKTSAFESQVFSRATSRHDYLEKIAEGLSKVENQVQQSAQLAAVAQQQQQQQQQVGGAAGVQAQAVLRQQLQQQHAHQQASLRQRQFMQHQVQQQQYHLQAQQMMLQRQQQAQQAQQQNVQAGIQKQDTGRKSATTKRQPGGVDVKTKTSGATKSSNSASTAGQGGRGKAQTLSHGNSANSDMFSRKNQGQIGSKPGAFPTAPGSLNGGVASNDYLMAFARQQQGQQGNSSQQAQISAHGGTAADGMGHGSQHGHQVSSEQISNVPSGQQTSQHTQQQQRVGQDPHSILSHQSLRQSQGLTNQNMNVAGNAALSGVMMDATNGSSNVENRRAVAMATIAATAAAAGMEFTAEQARNLTPEQIRQILAMATQRNGSGNFSGNGSNQNAGMPSTSAGPNMSSWLGQFANSGVGRGGVGQGQPAGQNHALSQALAFEKQKQLQYSRHQQLQSASVQAGTTPAPGKRGSQNAVASASAAGVTVPQMNAILAKESAKIEKFAGTAQEKQAALVEALQASNRARGSQGRQSTSQEHVPVGALSGGTSGTSAGMANGHGSHMSGTAGETEFWAKLQDMQAKYKASLKKLFPIIQRYQDRQPEKNKEAFMKHLRDCFNILSLQRPAAIPPRLTTVVLERAERFIAQVVTVYSRHLREMVENTTANPERRRQIAAQRDARGVIPSSIQPGTGLPNQPGSRAPQAVLPQQGKAEQTLQQGVPPHLDAQQQQQYARFQQQQVQLQKQQKTQSLKQTQLQLHQQQQQKQQSLQQGGTLPQPMQSTQVSPVQGVTSQDQASHGPPQSSQPTSFHSHQKSSHNQTSQGSAADNAKSQGKGSVAKGQGRRGGISKGGRGGTQLGAPRGSLSGAMQSHSQVQARTQAQVQAQVHAQVQAQAQAQAAAAAQAHAQVQAAAQAQAAQAQAVEVQAHVQAQQAHAQVQAQSQRLQQQMRAEQNVQRAQHSRTQRSSLMRQQAQQSRLRGQSPIEGNKQHVGTQRAGGWAGSYPGQAGLMGVVPNGAPTSGRTKRPELTPQQRVQMLEATVKDALENAHRLETYVDGEMKRAKSERIQNTLAALRNNASVKAAIMGNKKGTKRQASLVDVDNFGDKGGVIKSKTVFECSSEAGLRLAKKPKNEAQDLKSLREAVEADCRAAEERNPLLLIEIIEEFGQPVVTCLLKITEIKLPKLVLRVQRGYPRKGGATFGFERPPMGWVGVLDEIRSRFRRALTTMPAASVGVAAFLDAWAREADAVINGSHLSENR